MESYSKNHPSDPPGTYMVWCSSQHLQKHRNLPSRYKHSWEQLNSLTTVWATKVPGSSSASRGWILPHATSPHAAIPSYLQSQEHITTWAQPYRWTIQLWWEEEGHLTMVPSVAPRLVPMDAVTAVWLCRSLWHSIASHNVKTSPANAMGCASVPCSWTNSPAASYTSLG